MKFKVKVERVCMGEIEIEAPTAEAAHNRMIAWEDKGDAEIQDLLCTAFPEPELEWEVLLP